MAYKAMSVTICLVYSTCYDLVSWLSKTKQLRCSKKVVERFYCV